MSNNETKFLFENLKKARINKGLTQEELGEKVNLKQNAIANYETGNRKPNIDKLFEISDVLNMHISDFFEYSFTPISTTDKVISKPISHIGSGSCGFGCNNEDTITEWFDIPTSWIKGNSDDYFLCDGVGDSMIDAMIANGSVLLCKQQSTLENGQIGAFVLNNEDYIKRYKKEGDVILLESANSNYGNIIVTKNDDFRIVGKVIKVVTSIN